MEQEVLTMDIRKAEHRDIPGMIALLKQVGQVHHNIRPDLFRNGAQKYHEADLEQLLSDPNRPIFVAVRGGFVLGYCFCIHKEYQHEAVLTDRKELYIDDLCVEETCRGQGIASALYAYVQAYAKEQGYQYLTLNVWCGNNGAMKFYENAGMTPRNITMEWKLC